VERGDAMRPQTGYDDKEGWAAWNRSETTTVVLVPRDLPASAEWHQKRGADQNAATTPLGCGVCVVMRRRWPRRGLTELRKSRKKLC
jgi:hypothetical protein